MTRSYLNRLKLLTPPLREPVHQRRASEINSDQQIAKAIHDSPKADEHVATPDGCPFA